MKCAFPKNDSSRPAGAATVVCLLSECLESFQAACVNRRSDLVSGAACIGSRAFDSIGWVAIAGAIAFGLHQPIGAAIRP